MYNWYKDLIQIKKMYPKGAKLEYHSSSSNNVMVLKVTGENKALVIYINVGTGTNDYQMNPSNVLSAEAHNVYTMNGAPNNIGGNIGAVPWSISVFSK